MGLFSKIKSVFTKKEEKKETVESKEIKTYEKGLEKTKKEFVNKLNILGIKYTKINDDFFDELEELLIMSDISVETVMFMIDKLKKRCKEEKIENFDELKEVIVDELLFLYVDGEVVSSKLNIKDNELNVVLFVGVNGVGKTTSIAKLASKLVKDNKKVMLIAGDTFRAGAVEQLSIWAKRVGCEFFGSENKDPSSVVYDGLELAKKENIDVVLVDTAGRLQNKTNLMMELEKINKVINNVTPNALKETLLVIDASTGQNGIDQAKSFKEITNVTGLILTKMDGSAKGGIVLSIKKDTGIPVKFIGFGETVDDLMSFDIEKYIYGLFKEF
jgi:fused signal recognition particle receptor